MCRHSAARSRPAPDPPSRPPRRAPAQDGVPPGSVVGCPVPWSRWRNGRGGFFMVLLRGRVALGRALIAALILVAGSATPAAAQAPTGTVTIVHAFRGLVADVYLDGKVALTG